MLLTYDRHDVHHLPGYGGGAKGDEIPEVPSENLVEV